MSRGEITSPQAQFIASRAGIPLTDFRHCDRCKKITHDSDFKTDWRWGETCNVCYNELFQQHGEYKP